MTVQFVTQQGRTLTTGSKWDAEKIADRIASCVRGDWCEIGACELGSDHLFYVNPLFIVEWWDAEPKGVA